MKRFICFCLFISAVLFSVSVSADDVTISSEQPDYYFIIGKEARIPFSVESQFPGTVIGTLQYSLTRNQEEGGFSLSQTSTQSQSFPIAPGISHHAITLGSDVPSDYDINLLLIYSDKGKDYAVILPVISVHFVEGQDEIIQEKQVVRSSTSEATKSPSSLPTPGSMEFIEQQMEEMRKQQERMIKQMLSSSGAGMSPQTAGTQNPEQALLNNQVSPQMGSLMEQLQEESEENRKNQEELALRLAEDPLVRDQVADLNRAGYNQTSGKILATGPDQGEISAGFEDRSGDEVTMNAKAVNYSVAFMQVHADGEVPVPPILSSNVTWNEYKDSLASDGMAPTSGIVTRSSHGVEVSQGYTSPDGRNASLHARIVNGTIDDIRLVKDDEFPLLWFAGIFLVILLVILCAGVLIWYYTTRKPGNDTGLIASDQPVDIRERVLTLVDEAERSFTAGERKDGYVLLGQALRLYLSHQYADGISQTNDEIQKLISHQDFTKPSQVLGILEKTTLVEYAKEEPDSETFKQYIAVVRENAKE